MSSRTRMPAYGYPPPQKSSPVKNILLIGSVFVISAFSGVGLAAWLSPAQEPAAEVAATVPAEPEAKPVEMVAEKAPRPDVEITAATPEPDVAEPVTAAVETALQQTIEVAAAVPPEMLSDAPFVPVADNPVALLPQAETTADPAPVIEEAPVVAAVEPPAPVETVAAVEPVQIAETEADVVALEQQLTENGNAYFQVPQKEEAPFEAVAPKSNLNLPKAWTNAWVNMRAAPDNNGRTIAILASGKEIRAETNCAHWCKVTADGKTGYIYKSFIRR